MRRTSQLIALLMFGALVMAAWPVQAAISGTSHDFSGDGWNPSGEICVVCHTPHNSDTSVAEAPLWNHEVSVATYDPYANAATLDATVGQPAGISLLCLSCHDGTVALDNFGGNLAGANFIPGSRNVGTDLTNDHPVSFTYDAALAATDGELADPSTITPLVLFGGQLECGTCHDVHGVGGVSALLRTTNAASALCLTCHLK